MAFKTDWSAVRCISLSLVHICWHNFWNVFINWEYFEIKHVTGDLSRRGSWCFLLFFGLENPQKQ